MPIISNDGTYIEPEEVGEERARELAQYYRPQAEARDEAVFLPYPDTVLQAHAQLATYRMDVQRAMIGLVDKDSSYFVAEATKTLDLQDTNMSEVSGDGLHYGSISIPKKGGLVEYTLAQQPYFAEGQEVPAHLEILDLSKDPQFKDSRFVRELPHFRYYCGVPLRTENEINIGALFLLDDKPRRSTNIARLKVLCTLAQNVMVHMKTVREALEKQRAIHMNMCLADFISPENGFRSRHLNPRRRSDSATRTLGTNKRSSLLQIDESITPSLSRQSSTVDSIHSEDPDQPQPLTEASLAKLDGRPPLKTRADSGSHDGGDAILGLFHRGEQDRGRSGHQTPASEDSARSEPKKAVTETDHQRVFDRAAYLLRQAMDLRQPGGGGVVFFDTNAQATSTDPLMKREGSDYDRRRRGAERRSSGVPDDPLPSPNLDQTAYSGAIKERVVLAAASIQPPDNKSSPKNFGRADPTLKVTLAPPELARMCKRHPKGKLFNIPDNCGTSLFDWEGRPIAGKLSTKMYDMVLLHRQFPDAKQVIFVPMFHASLNRWTSCFVYSSSRYRVFSYEMDYLPILAFCNSIKAEIVRLATVFADKQKSDFIGSVSHELRSPLHGILASIEFLQDTDCDTFQKSCIDTMDACAQTLLDTIAMVLDYNKCNTHQRQTSSGSGSRERDRQPTNMPTTTNLRSEPIFATDEDCDVALITEEVIDGLATGHMAKHRTNTGFDDAPLEFNPTLTDAGVCQTLRRVLNAVRPEVELILDIQGPPSDWAFQTQPGAIRRIVMNLFGNSLKYTKHGHITVSLRIVKNHPRGEDQAVKFSQDESSVVKLTVADTGQGMSPEYLRTKVFTPFSQENATSAGTGLGLSIVRSLVTMLKGEIDIKSIVNVGTMVAITLPMKRATARVMRSRTGSPERHHPPLTAAIRTRDASVSALLSLQNPPQVAIYEPALEDDSFGQTQGAASVHRALKQYLADWYGFPTLATWDFDLPAKILVIDEIHLPTLLARRPDYLDTVSRQNIIVLCANPSRQAIIARDIQSSQVELVCKPFGPFKLARSICRALEKAAKPATTCEYVEVLESPLYTPSIDSRSRRRGRISIDHGDVGPSVSRARSPLPTPSKEKRPSLATVPKPDLLDLGPAHLKEVSGASDGGFPFLSKHGQSNLPAEIASELLPQTHNTKASEGGKVPQQGTTQSALRPGYFRAPSTVSPKTLQALKTGANAQAEGSGARASETASSTTGATSHWEAPSFPQERKPVILLVDDNQLNLDLLQTFVTRKGYGADIVKTAADGQEAVDAFHRYAPDIVFMDLSMPVMDGHEATRIIREIELQRKASIESAELVSPSQELPEFFGPGNGGAKEKKRTLVVALTGNAKGVDQDEAFDSGVDIYMTKPVSFKQVGKLLDYWREGTE